MKKHRNLTMIFWGAVLLIYGLFWLLTTLEVIPSDVMTYLFSWQTALMLIGVYLVSARKALVGGVVFLIGLIYAVETWFGISFPLRNVIFPAIVVAVGIILLIRGLKKS